MTTGFVRSNSLQQTARSARLLKSEQRSACRPLGRPPAPRSCIGLQRPALAWPVRSGRQAVYWHSSLPDAQHFLNLADVLAFLVAPGCPRGWSARPLSSAVIEMLRIVRTGCGITSPRYCMENLHSLRALAVVWKEGERGVGGGGAGLTPVQRRTPDCCQLLKTITKQSPCAALRCAALRCTALSPYHAREESAKRKLDLCQRHVNFPPI